MIYAGSIVSFLTSSVVSVAVNDTSVLLLSMIKDAVIEYPALNKIIEKIDLNAKLNLIENLMNEIPENYEKNKTIAVGLSNLHETVLKIQDELKVINNIIHEHEQKYFYYWRTPYYYYNLVNIEKYNKTLDERFDILLKLITTFNILK